MKKYILLVVSAVVLAFTSCSDSEEIDIVQYEENVTLNVNLSSAFETWGLSNFEKILGNNKSLSIGVTSLVYDENGDLYRIVKSHFKTFGIVEQTIEKIEEGRYTVVTFETIVNDDNDYESDAWILSEVDKLNTLMVCMKDERIYSYWHEAFGVASSVINVGKNKDKDFSITPNSIGCLIDVSYENFTNVSYNIYSFSVLNKAIGYKLAPNIIGKNRFYYDEYTPINEWSVIGYFYSGEEILDESDGDVFFFFETGVKDCLFAASENMFVNDKITYDDDIKATFNFEDGKYYTAFAHYTGGEPAFETYLGLYDEFEDWYKNNDFTTIEPFYAIYSEPCTNWGTSVANVKNFMNKYELLSDIEESSLGGYSMAYVGLNKELFIEYGFETNISGLYMASVYVSDTEVGASMQEVLEQLESQSYKYVMYDGDNGYYLYENDMTYVLVMSYEYEGMNITIVEYVDREYIEGMGQTRTADVFMNILNYSIDRLNNKQIFK